MKYNYRDGRQLSWGNKTADNMVLFPPEIMRTCGGITGAPFSPGLIPSLVGVTIPCIPTVSWQLVFTLGEVMEMLFGVGTNTPVLSDPAPAYCYTTTGHRDLRKRELDVKAGLRVGVQKVCLQKVICNGALFSNCTKTSECTVPHLAFL